MNLKDLIKETKFTFTLKSKHGWYDKTINAPSKEEAEKELKDFLKRTKMKGWTYQLKEGKDSLKTEYEKLKNEPFPSKQTLKRMEEIERELNINPDRWNKTTKVKFKKSQRVTPFNRTRS